MNNRISSKATVELKKISSESHFVLENTTSFKWKYYCLTIVFNKKVKVTHLGFYISFL